MAGQRTTALAGLTADGRSTCAIRSMLRDDSVRAVWRPLAGDGRPGRGARRRRVEQALHQGGVPTRPRLRALLIGEESRT